MSNAQKTPLSRTLPIFVKNRALDEIVKRGQALPGHVVAVDLPFVTVNFDITGVTLPRNLQLPLVSAEYSRLPIQVNDKGYAFPVGTYLGGITGVGGGVADTELRGNLSTLVWYPLASKNWGTVPGGDENTYSIYGKTASQLLDSIAGNSTIKLTATGITMASGGHTIVINASGVTIDGKVFLTHDHTGVQTGSGVTGPVG